MYVERGTPAYHIAPNERGQTISVIATIAADGFFAPPMVIYPGKREMAYLENGLPPNSTVTLTESGYANADTFVEYLNHFQSNRRFPDRPCVLICDGHASHFSIQAIEMARSSNINILIMPAHCTHPYSYSIQVLNL